MRVIERDPVRSYPSLIRIVLPAVTTLPLLVPAPAYPEGTTYLPVSLVMHPGPHQRTGRCGLREKQAILHTYSISVVHFFDQVDRRIRNYPIILRFTTITRSVDVECMAHSRDHYPFLCPCYGLTDAQISALSSSEKFGRQLPELNQYRLVQCRVRSAQARYQLNSSHNLHACERLQTHFPSNVNADVCDT